MIFWWAKDDVDDDNNNHKQTDESPSHQPPDKEEKKHGGSKETPDDTPTVEDSADGKKVATTDGWLPTTPEENAMTTTTTKDVDTRHVKPHDLPLIVQTGSSGQSFGSNTLDDDDYFAAAGEENDSFHVDGVKPIFVGTPFSQQTSHGSSKPATVRDMIKKFGSPGRRAKNKNLREQFGAAGRQGSCSSLKSDDKSANSRKSNRSDTHLGRDDDSLTDLSYASLPMHYEPQSRPSPGREKTRSELDMLREKSIVSSRRRSQRRSAARRDRLHYKLGSGKKGMTPKDLSRSHSFLPADKLIEMKQTKKAAAAAVVAAPQIVPQKPAAPPPPPAREVESEMYVWLLSTETKIFEIVRVPYHAFTSIGEALASARAAALDPVLAEQRYVSLCNERLELVAPAMPVTMLFNHKSTKQSLMAVPDGSTAFVVRAVQKSLLENPRMRKWLQQEDIFRPISAEEKRRKRIIKKLRRSRKEKKTQKTEQIKQERKP